MGLGAFRDKFVHELSTGSRRIVDLACMLAHQPTVLLLDEPSSGIAQREAEALGPLLLRIRDSLGASILVIEHDLPLLTSVADRMIAMDLGEVIAEGDPSDVVHDPWSWRRTWGPTKPRSPVRADAENPEQGEHMEPTNRRETGGRPSPWKRYGPFIAIVVVIAVIGGIVAHLEQGRLDSSSTTTSTTGGGGGNVKAATIINSSNKDSINWGPNCDTSTEQVKIPCTYAAPCVKPFSGRTTVARRPTASPRTRSRSSSTSVTRGSTRCRPRR